MVCFVFICIIFNSTFMLQRGGAAMLRYYKGSHVSALQSLYPELKLSEQRFLRSKIALKAT
jgi:hypothetical protein